MGAIVVGAIQLLAPKGTIPHRAFGWTWIGLVGSMLIIAFFNQGFSLWDPFGPGICCHEPHVCGDGRTASCASVHLVSAYFLLALPYGALHAHRHDIFNHRIAMWWLFLGVLLVGTLLTFLPHRIMHEVLFGP